MTFDQAVPYLLALIALGVVLVAVAAVRVGSLSERRNVVDLDAQRRLRALGRASGRTR